MPSVLASRRQWGNFMLFSDIKKIASNTWRFSWASGTAPYRVYLRGKLLATISAEFYEIEELGAADEPPPLEVLDAAGAASPDSVLNPCRAILQWRAVSAAKYYVVRELVSASWQKRAQIQEVGCGYYSFESAALADGSATSWRVVAIDALGNESAPVAFSVTTVRNPEPPEVSLAYDDGVLTVRAI